MDDVDRLSNKIKLMPSLIRETVRKAVEEQAMEIRDTAKALLVSNQSVDTGQLLESIVFEVEETPSEVRARIGSDLFYSRFVELGTSPSKKPKIVNAGKRQFSTEPRPFLGPAFSIYRRVISKDIRAAVRGVFAKKYSVRRRR